MSWPLFLSGCGLLLTGYVAGWLAGREAERLRQRRQIAEGLARISAWLQRPATGSLAGLAPDKPVVFLRRWSAN